MLTSHSQLTNSFVYARWIFKWPEKSRLASSPVLHLKKKGTQRTQRTINTYAAVPATRMKRLGSEDPMRRFWCWCGLTLNNNCCYYAWISNGHCDKFKRKWAFCESEDDMRTRHWLQVFWIMHLWILSSAMNGWGKEGPWFLNALISLLKHRRNIVIFELRSS